MPVEVKAKDGKVYAIAIVGNRIRCGHCDMPLLDGQSWWAFDSPYQCLVHEACLKFFEYNGKCRANTGEEGKSKQQMELNAHEQVVGQFMERPYFRQKLPQAVQTAWLYVFKMYLVLRESYGDLMNAKLKKVGTKMVEEREDASK